MADAPIGSPASPRGPSSRPGSAWRVRARAARASPRLAAASYALAAAALALLFDHRFLFTTKIGGPVSDWSKDIYYFEYLKYGLSHWTIPASFFVLPGDIDSYSILSRSLTFWGNPEVGTVSPWYLLLLVMPVAVFIKVNFAIHLAIGGIGVWVLGRRLGVGPVWRLALFVLLCLNPWLLEHMAIGYSPWIAVTYVPFVAAFAFGDAPPRAREIAIASVFDALMLYEGAVHAFFWANGALVSFAVLSALARFSYRPAVRPALILFGTALVALPKLVAVTIGFGSWYRIPQGSYSSLGDLWGIFTDAHTNPYLLPQAYDVYGVNLYDGSLFMGKLFLALAAVALAVRFARSARAASRTEALTLLVLPAVALVWLALGWDHVWRHLAAAFHPLSVDNYPWRFLNVTVPLVVVLVVVELWRLAQLSRVIAVVSVALLVVVGFQLERRNELFARAATTWPYSTWQAVTDPASFVSSSSEAVDDFTHARLAIVASPDALTIKPAGSITGIDLPWLAASHANEFEFENAQAEPTSTQTIRLVVDDPRRNVVVRGKTYGRLWLTLAGLLLYAGYLGVIAGRVPALRRSILSVSTRGTSS